MDIQKLPFNNQLKKVQLDQISFYPVDSKDLTFVSRGSEVLSKFNFRDDLLSSLGDLLGSEVLRLLILSPAKSGSPYEAFAYLKDRHIVALHLADVGSFRSGMNEVLRRWNDKQEESEKQPSQALVSFSKGLFSIQSANSDMRLAERPYEDTGKFLHKHAPDKYNEAKIAREKRNYLKKYVNLAGAELNAELLKKIFVEFTDQRNLEIIPPVDNQAIYQEFEELAGFPFPEELKELLGLHNGVNNTGFLDATQILKEWKGWKEVYDDWPLQELRGNSRPDGKKTLGMYTTPYWVPFLSTGGGNFVGIDYVPASQGQSGQIIAFGADEDKIRLIAENMIDFLQQFLDGKDVLNNGFGK